jgi:hypothetical protein
MLLLSPALILHFVEEREKSTTRPVRGDPRATGMLRLVPREGERDTTALRLSWGSPCQGGRLCAGRNGQCILVNGCVEDRKSGQPAF